MATDLATLSIKVENGDVVKATTSLDGLTVAGGKTEAATQRLTRRMALLEIEARQMAEDMQRGGRAMNALEIEARQMDAALNKSARAMALVEIEARQMDAAMNAAKQAAYAAELRKTSDAYAKLEQSARRTGTEVEKTGKIGSQAGALMRQAFVALGAAITIREVASLADAYTNLRARLALVTTGTANLNAVQAALFEQAQRTRTSFESTADLYVRLARSANSVGASQAKMLQVTETINKAMIISGASASSAQAALVQLGQAFASNRLGGEELNSVLEQSPRLADAIAAGMGKTTGELKNLAKEGKLTAKAVFDALVQQRDAVDTEFAKMPATIGGSLQQVQNEILKVFGDSGGATSATGGIVIALNGIRDAIAPTARVVASFFTNFALGAAEAAIWTEKLKQKTGEWQEALGRALAGRGQQPTGIAKFLIDNAQAAQKGGADVIRLMEKQRDAIVYASEATAQLGTVSTETGKKIKAALDPEAVKAYKKLMDELRDAVKDAADAELERGIAGAKTVGDATRAIDDELASSELLLEAAQKGVDAYKAQQQEIEVLNKLTQMGLTLGDQEYEQAKRRLEIAQQNKEKTDEILDAQKKASDEAQRQLERNAKELHRTVSSTIEGILTDIDNRRNAFVAIFENLKRGAIRAISDILATKIQDTVGDFLGIKQPATKQQQAADLMNKAADKQVRAAEAMNGTAGGIVIRDNSARSTAVELFKKAMGLGGSAYGGFQTGYGIGAATGNRVVGAVGGAFAGAKLGGAIAGPAGAAVGGIAGFVGGLMGAADAAEQAKERMRQLKEAFQNTFDALRAELNKDTLGQATAQVKAQYADAERQFRDQLTLGDLLNGTRRKEAFGTLEKLNEMEAKRIAQLEEEAAAMRRYFDEDLDERILRDQGKTAAADELHRRHEQEREREEFRRTHYMPDTDDPTTTIDNENWTTYNKLLFAQSLETKKNTDALNALTTSMRGAPSGFKLEPYIQEFAKARPYPGQFQVPTTPFSPPMSPMPTPTFSRTSGASVAPVQMTFSPGAIQINGTNLSADEISKAFIRTLDGVKERAFGASSRITRAEAMERMPS